MTQNIARRLLNLLAKNRPLTWRQWRNLLASATDEDRRYAKDLAGEITRSVFGKLVFYRGIIEFTNHCANNCLYCGIRKGNTGLVRYRLSERQILEACADGYALGVRTFVLQGGEDQWFTDARLEPIIEELRQHFPDAAITLSLGERSRESYQRLFAAGANRYLLRHETADPKHYRMLHAPKQSFWRRMNCLHMLREMGYQTGCGMMVGTPWQNMDSLAEDMYFIQAFRPQMIGIGPFLPHHATPFHNRPAGNAELTLFLLSLCRIMNPRVLLPATTALRTLLPDGLTQGIAAGCNVVMPHLTAPTAGYELYDGKPAVHDLNGELQAIREELVAAGYALSSQRGDYMQEVQPKRHRKLHDGIQTVFIKARAQA
ncbi:MAG: [Desulfovibrio sp.]|nr:[FeFe] hydrogenase H-cluster radical SAM maturase HydE [Desulfovibrio sp.]